MRIKFAYPVLLSLALLACTGENDLQPSSNSPTDSAEPEVTYLTTASFDEEVLQSDIPVLIDFTAEWCVPCQVVDPVIMSLYPEMAGRAKVFKLDIDDEPEIYDRLGVNGVPHILFFNNGQEQDRIVSPQPRDIYVQYLEAMIEGRSTLEVSLRLLEEDSFRRQFMLTRSIEDIGVALKNRPDFLSAPLENGQPPLSMILNTPSVRQNDLIEFALANGAAPTTRDLVGLGHCDQFIAALADDPAAVDRADPDGVTPLYLALARSGRSENNCIWDVVSAGADPAAHQSQRYHLGRMVALYDDLNLVNQLLDRGMSPSLGDANGNDLVHLAARYGKVDLLRILVDRGTDLTSINDKGETPAEATRTLTSRFEETILNGVDAYGQEITADYAKYINEKIEINKEVLRLLGG